MESSQGDVSRLAQLLRSSAVQRTPLHQRAVVERVIECMTQGLDVAPLFNDMVKAAGVTNDVITKKLIYLYMGTHASTHPEMAVMMINTLRKDSKDARPSVCGLAIRAMSSLRVPDVTTHLKSLVVSSVSHVNIYVRKSAVCACMKLYDAFPEEEFLRTVRTAIHDKHPNVAAMAILALDDMMREQGGFPLSEAFVISLLERLPSFAECYQAALLQLIRPFTPTHEKTAVKMLNLLDKKLDHANVSIVIGAVHIFLNIAGTVLPHIHNDVVHRVTTVLLPFLMSEQIEVVYSVLLTLEPLFDIVPELIHPVMLYFRAIDSSYLKRKKLHLMVRMATPTSGSDVMEELCAYALSEPRAIARASIDALSALIIKLSALIPLALPHFISWIDHDEPYIVGPSISGLAAICAHVPSVVEEVIPHLPALAMRHNVLREERRALVAMLWFFGTYPLKLASAPYLLEDLIDVLENAPVPVRLQLLTTTMKMFFLRPGETQGLLGRLLTASIKEELHPEVHDRALLYYRLLLTDVNAAQRIVA